MSTDLSADDLRQLLTRCWMTHDAMWFASAASRLGIEEANALNRAAVRAAAQIEAKRVLKLMGMHEITGGPDLRRFFETAASLLIGDFITYRWTWSPGDETLRFDMEQCFAFDGVTKLGAADRYECGIFERVFGWLDTLSSLGVHYTVSPERTLCMMEHEGSCYREFRFTFGGSHGSGPEAAAP